MEWCSPMYTLCCFTGATHSSLHGVGFHCIEDHGVTSGWLFLVTFRRGDLVSIKCIFLMKVFIRSTRTQRVKWTIAITWRPLSVRLPSVNFKKKSSPLKLLKGFKPNLGQMILRVSSSKMASEVLIRQKTWPPLLRKDTGIKICSKQSGDFFRWSI
jgi:hypothetical protein